MYKPTTKDLFGLLESIKLLTGLEYKIQTDGLGNYSLISDGNSRVFNGYMVIHSIGKRDLYYYLLGIRNASL